MKNALTAALAVTLSSSLPAISAAQPQMMTRAMVSPKALQAAPGLAGAAKKLIRDQDAKRLGFDDIHDVPILRLGVPFREYFVRLDKLKAYTPPAKVDSLLDATPNILYPLNVKGTTKSSMTVAEQGGKFTPTTFGPSKLMQKLDDTRATVAKAQKLQLKEFFVVKVPALGLIYVAFEQSGTIFLTPLVDDPSIGVKAGNPELADAILGKLVQIAGNLRTDAPT